MVKRGSHIYRWLRSVWGPFSLRGARILPADVIHVGSRPVAESELVMVTLRFDATDPDRLQGLLAKYTVLTRGHPGCRNVDLVASATRPNRFLVVEKWDSAESQRTHFDSVDMVELAEGCVGLLASPPEIDLYDSISAHDLH